ncbi:hypothetical protein LINPERHAP1_LOCUS35586 [Linum perenne]
MFILLIVLVNCLALTAAQKNENCGERKVDKDEFPDYRSNVEKVVTTLVNVTPGPQIHVAHSPNATVGAAAGAAVCYAKVKKTCRDCLRDAAVELKKCDTLAGGFSGQVCVMQFWQTFD